MDQITPSLERLQITVDEVAELGRSAREPAQILAEMARLLGNRFQVDVCSVYLLESDRSHLVLAATVGLRQDSPGRIRMALDEGLAGLVAENLEPVAVEEASQHPRFKYFPEAGEDLYRSFLGVPVVDHGVLQGVLVVQTTDARSFSESERNVLKEASRLVAPVVASCRALENFVAPVRERLWTMARNLWWCWDEDVTSLFRDLEPVRWRQLLHNPIALLSETSLTDVEQRAGQKVLHSRVNYAFRRMRDYMKGNNTWGGTHAGILGAHPVAYFSAEFGLHESLPIYSGGLGVLAGDHIKSASDLGVPLVGIGLFYRQGYFHQRLTISGWQEEDYVDLDFNQLPVEPAMGRDGRQVVVEVETRTTRIQAQVWRVMVGRTVLLLLDSDVDGNRPVDRQLTSRLYGGDERVRIHQELLLGVGGLRALHALGIQPSVFHLNEGHSAFAVLEAIRLRMAEDGMSFDDASREVARQTVFTTHTPVPAGHDRFPADLIEENLGVIREQLGISPEHLMSLGRVDAYRDDEPFCMTVLALKLSQRANAVSALHGRVSRSMWQCLWPNRSEAETPIGHITNGIHVLSWLAPQMQQLFDRNLGPDWRKRTGEPQVWEKVDEIDDGELWETHQALKTRLIDFVRRRAVRQAKRRDEAPEQIEQWQNVLSPDALTIGFARRFATYKRANLIFRDLDVIAELVNDPKRPVQIVFAGKAHPRDEPGKRVLQTVAELARDPQFAGKLVFIEDYEMNVGRHLVQGVDVWLNNPRRPLEASGTSGQKVVLNAGLNLSILDGWWAEAYDGTNGFAIGTGTTHRDEHLLDERDAASLLRVLREEVIPLYYHRNTDGLPVEWLARVKRAIRTLGWRFSADRMVMDYATQCYVPAAGGVSCEIRPT